MNPSVRPAVELTVLIPSKRPVDAIAPALDALAQQNLAADRYEVIVVLDGPDDGRVAALSRRRDPYPLVVVAGPGLGRAAACNVGLGVASGAVALLLDDDMAPRPDALAAHLARHAGHIPKAVMGAVPVLVPFDAQFSTRYIARRFARHMAKLANPGTAIHARDVYTGAFSIPRRILRYLGGFDERIREYGNEDVELAARLLQLGVPIVFAPEAACVQTYQKSFAELAADYVASGRTAVRFVELHPERSAEAGVDRIFGGSRRHRLACRAIAGIARSARGRRFVIATAERLGSALERIHPQVADRFTGTVLEACFQLGAWEAYRERTAAQSRRTVIHYSDSTAWGGSERVALTIMSGLDRARWRPLLVVHDHAELGPLVEEARARGIETYVLPPLRGPGGLLGLARLARLFRLLHPAVVHIHRAWAPSGIAAVLAAALARVPARVATEHLFLSTTPRRVLWLRRLLVDRLLHRHVAVSDAGAEVLREQLHIRPDRIAVVANGIIAPAEPQAATVRAVRRPLAVPDGDQLVIVPAQLRRQKGHETLLEALRALPHVVAAFAGEGPERAALAARAAAAGTADRVRFLGFRRDLPTLLAAGDVVVLPSESEGLPLAVLEAQALGRPVVASAVGGTPEAIEDGVNGLLVPPHDADALAAAIRSLLGDPIRARRLGNAGRESVRLRFTAERMVRQTAELYEELLEDAAVVRAAGRPASLPQRPPGPTPQPAPRS